MTQIKLSPERRERRSYERHRCHLGLLNYWTLEIKKKKCISFIIWVTALAYNEMLIN